MERSNSVSPGPSNSDDSWTCQRCGWVYPNAHPSAKHRRNHKKQCGKIKGSELPPELQKGGSSDEVSSGDDSHGKKDTLHSPSTTAEASGAGLAVEHPSATESQNLHVNEANVSDTVHKSTPLPESISAPLDTKLDVIDHESSGDVINIDTMKTDSPPPKSDLDNVLLYSPLSRGISAPLDTQPEVIHSESKREKTDSSAPIKNTSRTGEEGKGEELPIDLPKDVAIIPANEHAKPYASVESAVAVECGLPELDSDQAKKRENRDEKSECFSPKSTDTIISMEKPSNYPPSGSKMTLTPLVGKVETNAHETHGLDSDHVTLKGRSLTSKEEGLNRQGANFVEPIPLHAGSSQGDDSWTCHRCGWVYPNAHPSAKHRKKHKKKCGKIKGFPLHTGLHDGGSSDEVSSSDEDIQLKKEHTSDQATQNLKPQESGNQKGAENVPTSTDHSAVIAEGEINAQSGSNDLQPKESNALKRDAFDGDPRDTSGVRDISSPSNVFVLPDNTPPLDQQNLQSAIGRESSKSSEMQNPSFPEKDDTFLKDVSGDLGKDAHYEFSREGAPMVADIPVISDSKSSQFSTPDIQSISDFNLSKPSLPEDKGSGFLEVDEPNTATSGMDKGGSDLSNEALDASAGGDLNRCVNDVTEKPGFCGSDTVSDLNASDDTMIGNPPRKETGDSFTGWLDSRSKPENHDFSSQILPADEISVENKSVTENRLHPTAESAAVVSGLAQDAERERTFPNLEPSVSPAEQGPSAQIVEQGNDVAFSSPAPKADETSPVEKVDETSPAPKVDETFPVEKVDETSPALKVDETPPVPNWEHRSDKQTASGVVTGLAADSMQLLPKNEPSARIVTGENDDAHFSTVEKIHETPSLPELDHSSDDQVALAQAVDMDVPQEVTGEGTSIQRSIDGSSFKNVSHLSEDPGQVGGTQNTNTIEFPEYSTEVAAIAEDKELGGSYSVQKNREDKSEAGGTPEANVESEAIEETSRGLGSSDLNNSETHSFPRSESAVTVPSELGGSSHNRSDSLEIFEDAQDTLETSSVGGSVDENEGLDELRQASGRLHEELKPSEAGLLDVMEPGESVVRQQDPTVSSSSIPAELSSQEKATTLPGTSYGARTDLGDLKAPSPEAWQEPAGPSNAKIEGKKPSSSEVAEDSGAKYVPQKAEPIVETSTAAENLKSPMKKGGVLATSNANKKTKSRSFWRSCICCSTVP